MSVLNKLVTSTAKIDGWPEELKVGYVEAVANGIAKVVFSLDYHSVVVYAPVENLVLATSNDCD